MNIGVIKSGRNEESDEMYTPFYAVDPIIEYIPKGSKVWCPFDKNWSAYVVSLKENGINVINTHLENGQDFFNFKPDFEYDFIISNPPFSKKDQVLKRLKEINKPFAILLPLNSLQGKNRFEYLEDIQILRFDLRIGFHNNENKEKTVEGSPFASSYFCYKFLPKDLIGKKLNKYDRKLMIGEENKT